MFHHIKHGFRRPVLRELAERIASNRKLRASSNCDKPPVGGAKFRGASVSPPVQSQRSAVIGSARTARREGDNDAAIAASSTIRTARP